MRRINIAGSAKLRAAAIAASLLAAGTMLTACSEGGASAAGNSSQSGVQTIVPGTITIGSCLDQPPWGLKDSSGNPAGFDVDLAKQIAQYLNLKLETVDVTAAARVPSLQTGKVDLISCSFTITPERKQQIDFTIPTLASGNSLMVPQDSSIKALSDLDGKTVAVNKGGTAGPVTTAANPKAKLQYYESYSAAVLALTSGQADAVIDTSNTLAVTAAENPKLHIVNDGDVGPKVYFGLGVPKNKPELLKKLNEFVQQFHASGGDTKLFQTWFKFTPTYQFKDLPTS